MRIRVAADNEVTIAADNTSSPRFNNEVRDDLFRMLFVCCAEAIPKDSRLVLALKTLCGFSTSEIALRLFLSEANVLKRLGRAREHLREVPPDFNSLPLQALQSRLASVHVVLYLLFNEAYLSAPPHQPVPPSLTAQAL